MPFQKIKNITNKSTNQLLTMIAIETSSLVEIPLDIETPHIMKEMSVRIRAPAFARWMNTIDNAFIKVCDNLSRFDSENPDLVEIVRMMIATDGASATFPVKDPEILADMLLMVVRFYATQEKVKTKFNMCTAVQLMGTVMNPGNFNEKKLRVMECADLNNQLYEIGKEIIDKEVHATVEFVAVQTHEFHPDSEFVLFKVKYT